MLYSYLLISPNLDLFGVKSLLIINIVIIKH